MLHQTNRSYQNILSNWLLRLALLCSVFFFSGFVDALPVELPQLVQTECLLDENDLIDQLVYSYEVIDEVSITEYGNHFSNSLKLTLIAFNKLVKVKFSSQESQFLAIQTPIFFIHMKTISHHSDDEYFDLI